MVVFPSDKMSFFKSSSFKVQHSCLGFLKGPGKKINTVAIGFLCSEIKQKMFLFCEETKYD